MNGLTEEQLLLRNLTDAGCGAEDIERYLKLRAKGRSRRCSVSACASGKILDQVHESQEKLDCLDYLIYSMKRGKKDRR